MQTVFVLIDKDAHVYVVVRDQEVADAWLVTDGDFGVVECEVDDYSQINAISDELEELESEDVG